MGTYQPSLILLLRTNTGFSFLFCRTRKPFLEKRTPCYLNYLKKPQVKAGWERISGQVMSMSWGEQASILPLFSLGKFSFQALSKSVSLQWLCPGRAQESAANLLENARQLAYSSWFSREENSSVENNPKVLSTSLGHALIIDSTVYFKAL